LDVSGSAAVQKQVDTPLALYTFSGNLNLKENSGKVVVIANGKVQRTGKVAKQVSNQDVSGVQVNTSDGQATINVGGVNVTFKFF
jgi:folate-binding Fe-S cluster repair protein YgfZ